VKLRDVVETLGPRLRLRVVADAGEMDKEVTGGYTGDLLSHVIGKAQPGNIWVTVQSHPNIVAVAVMAGLSGIIIVEDAAVDAMTIRKAQDEHIPLFATPLNSYQVVAMLAQAGVAPAE
jgi:hypothetical protein